MSNQSKDDFGQDGYKYTGYQAQKNAEDWNEEKFLRRYRYAHLRNKSSVPMSIRNEDRHGMSNLMHERVKSLDKIHFPPYLIIGLFVVPVLVFVYSRVLS